MTRAQLATFVQHAKCRVFGADDASNGGHRLALASLIDVFNSSETTLLCEPSRTRKAGTSDIVLLDPEIGVHVFEVKAISLKQIEAIDPGGQMWIRYRGVRQCRNPLVQARAAMFDIKDAVAHEMSKSVHLPFEYWVLFTSFTRADWTNRFGADAFCPDKFLFGDDLPAEILRRRLRASERAESNTPINVCSLDQLQIVHRVFGDNLVLYTPAKDREARPTTPGTIGQLFDQFAESDKRLSDEQQRLSEMNWDGGPRQVRGVAGSGKTIVLANNLARFLQRRLSESHEGLFGPTAPRPRILAVCFNRSLAPYLQQKIGLAYLQRTQKELPLDCVEVCSFNTLMYRMDRAGLWRYRVIEGVDDIVRALNYLKQLEDAQQARPDQVREKSYDAIYVDEGQDFHEDEYRLLIKLCRTEPGKEPNLFVFYDDAQNLYGRARPNWQSLGLNVRGGRSFVMTQCFRNTRQILEPAFNVLYGTCAPPRSDIPTKEFGDISKLEADGHIEMRSDLWHVKFAPREGESPQMHFAPSAAAEREHVVNRLRWLIESQQVRPQDILILTNRQNRVIELAEAARGVNIQGVDEILISFQQKDRSLGAPGQLTFSTVASAKGYDASCVLLTSANEFKPDVKGRATFYVGCTRAVHRLEVSAYAQFGLAAEMRTVLQGLEQE